MAEAITLADVLSLDFERLPGVPDLAAGIEETAAISGA